MSDAAVDFMLPCAVPGSESMLRIMREMLKPILDGIGFEDAVAPALSIPLTDAARLDESDGVANTAWTSGAHLV